MDYRYLAEVRVSLRARGLVISDSRHDLVPWRGRTENKCAWMETKVMSDLEPDSVSSYAYMCLLLSYSPSFPVSPFLTIISALRLPAHPPSGLDYTLLLLNLSNS
ncbi:unnamed protein product [Allacma fusca]|uniref:Uncharacterized protein n=1 Tax=Allacma fusca TaxID=39272 RepID=A0A8J2LTY2_9HEXA|nr:unnamed protein product [Allacma fusca]